MRRRVSWPSPIIIAVIASHTSNPNPPIAKNGADVVPTIDCFTWMGCVKLGHSDQAVVDADYTRIHVIEVTGALFQSDDTDADGVTDGGSAPTEASVEEPANSPSRAVVVVDPFSTGAMVAAYANRANLPW